ncbi:MAG: hypothetical protein WDW38_003050 [Sanguina aurantia]
MDIYAGKSQTLAWVGGVVDLKLSRIEQLASGAVYCQLVDAYFPDVINISKVNFLAREEYECLPNYKLMQGALSRLGVTKDLDVVKLSKGSSAEHLELLQWILRFLSKRPPIAVYNASARRSLSVKGGTDAIPFPAGMRTSSDTFRHSARPALAATDGYRDHNPSPLEFSPKPAIPSPSPRTPARPVSGGGAGRMSSNHPILDLSHVHSRWKEGMIDPSLAQARRATSADPPSQVVEVGAAPLSEQQGPHHRQQRSHQPAHRPRPHQQRQHTDGPGTHADPLAVAIQPVIRCWQPFVFPRGRLFVFPWGAQPTQSFAAWAAASNATKPKATPPTPSTSSLRLSLEGSSSLRASASHDIPPSPKASQTSQTSHTGHSSSSSNPKDAAAPSLRSSGSFSRGSATSAVSSGIGGSVFLTDNALVGGERGHRSSAVAPEANGIGGGGSSSSSGFRSLMVGAAGESHLGVAKPALSPAAHAETADRRASLSVASDSVENTQGGRLPSRTSPAKAAAADADAAAAVTASSTAAAEAVPATELSPAEAAGIILSELNASARPSHLVPYTPLTPTLSQPYTTPVDNKTSPAKGAQTSRQPASPDPLNQALHISNAPEEVPYTSADTAVTKSENEAIHSTVPRASAGDDDCAGDQKDTHAADGKASHEDSVSLLDHDDTSSSVRQHTPITDANGSRDCIPSATEEPSGVASGHASAAPDPGPGSRPADGSSSGATGGLLLSGSAVAGSGSAKPAIVQVASTLAAALSSLSTSVGHWPGPPAAELVSSASVPPTLDSPPTPIPTPTPSQHIPPSPTVETPTPTSTLASRGSPPASKGCGRSLLTVQDGSGGPLGGGGDAENGDRVSRVADFVLITARMSDQLRRLSSTQPLDGCLKALGLAHFGLLQALHREMSRVTASFLAQDDSAKAPSVLSKTTDASGVPGTIPAAITGGKPSAGGSSGRRARVFRLGDIQLKQLRNGDTYKGAFSGTKKNGDGLYEFVNQDVYEGSFRDDRMDGVGVYTFSHEGRYEGHWKNAVYNGCGTETFAKGSTYHGEYAGGLRNGWGACRFYNSDYYEGQWANGLRDGRGMQQCTDDSNYVGEYVRGKRHGCGVYSFPNGDRYVGQYYEDLPHGTGVYFFASGGQQYRGQWKAGRKHGWSVYSVDGGCKFAGQWAEGKPQWVQPLAAVAPAAARGGAALEGGGDDSSKTVAASALVPASMGSLDTETLGDMSKEEATAECLAARQQANHAASVAHSIATEHWQHGGWMQRGIHCALSAAKAAANEAQECRAHAKELAQKLDKAVAALCTSAGSKPLNLPLA